MESELGQLLAQPIVASYLFNTAGSMADMISTALLHSHNGNPDEINENIQGAMNQHGSIGGGCIGEVARRVGFGVVTIGLLGVDKLIVPHFSEVSLHLAETTLAGMGFIYMVAASLNFITLLSTPRNR